jgi:hypothetical protein
LFSFSWERGGGSLLEWKIILGVKKKKKMVDKHYIRKTESEKHCYMLF